MSMRERKFYLDLFLESALNLLDNSEFADSLDSLDDICFFEDKIEEIRAIKDAIKSRFK